MKPFIFLLGPSGVGKSHLYAMFERNKFLCEQIDTDGKKRTFAAKGFPSEWDDDFQRVNLAHFVGELRGRLDNNHPGLVVSFPTVDRFTPEKLREAVQLGVTPVVLWGKKEDCIRAAKKRIEKKGRKFNLPRYERLNDPTFQAYGRPEYGAFRVEVFREDGSRYPNEKWLSLIMERTSG